MENRNCRPEAVGVHGSGFRPATDQTCRTGVARTSQFGEWRRVTKITFQTQKYTLCECFSVSPAADAWGEDLAASASRNRGRLKKKETGGGGQCTICSQVGHNECTLQYNHHQPGNDTRVGPESQQLVFLGVANSQARRKGSDASRWSGHGQGSP